MAKSKDQVAESILSTLQSRTVSDRNLKPANVVDVVCSAGKSLDKLAEAITPSVMPGHDAHGGTIASLTEAVMSVGASLDGIANAISELAEAIREKN